MISFLLGPNIFVSIPLCSVAVLLLTWQNKFHTHKK